MKKFVFGVVAGVLGMGASIAAAQQSVTLTSTADFQTGNNEGLISTAQDQLTRDVITAGTVGAWSTSTPLPSGRLGLSATYNGFVYAIGGFDETSALDVLVAPLNADGSVGAWSATTPLPSIHLFSSCVAYNGFLYIVAGRSDFGTTLSDVIVAPINADGTVGTWATTTALPSARSIHSSAVYKGFLYVLGGEDANFDIMSDVQVAPINADGSLGAWSTTTALPTGRAGLSSVAYNGNLYAIGGSPDIFNALAEVLVAQLNADGTVGTWTPTTALSSARCNHSSVVYNGFIYASGGETSIGLSADFNDVLVAPINADGTVGTWSPTTALPSARAWHASVAYNSFVYVIGGINSDGLVSDVLVAPIDADTGNVNQTPAILRGSVSYLVDLQSDTDTRSIILNGQTSPGGSVGLQVRIAPEDTKIFGEEMIVDPAPLGSAIQVPGTGRYVWIRLTLDDTLTTDATQPTTISDISVLPIAPPTAGIVHDGTGADIDTQTSTTTIEANWSGFTASSGDTIASYEWSIGSAFGLTDIQGWTDVGLATNATNSALSLVVGTTYYVQVRAVSGLGLTSDVSSSDGVEVVAPPTDGGGGGGGGGGGCSAGGVASGIAVTGIWFGALALLALAAAWRPWRT